MQPSSGSDLYHESLRWTQSVVIRTKFPLKSSSWYETRVAGLATCTDQVIVQAGHGRKKVTSGGASWVSTGASKVLYRARPIWIQNQDSVYIVGEATSSDGVIVRTGHEDVRKRPLSPRLSLSLSHTHTHTRARAHAHPVSLSLSLSLSHTHTHTHYISLSLSQPGLMLSSSGRVMKMSESARSLPASEASC